MDETSPSGFRGGQEEIDVQKRFGGAVWVWTIGSGILIAILIIMLVLSLAGFWSDPDIAPPT